MIRPVKELEKKPIELIPLQTKGNQSCADCSCEPNNTGEARKSCGRLS